MSSASSNVPGYQAPMVPAAKFVSYVGKGDPFANYGTNTAEQGSTSATIAHMDHCGIVVQLGNAADAATRCRRWKPATPPRRRRRWTR